MAEYTVRPEVGKFPMSIKILNNTRAIDTKK